MRRKKPSARGKPLARSGRLRRTATLRAKGKSRFPKRRDAEYCAAIRMYAEEFGCVLLGAPGHACLGPLQLCHVQSRGAGGFDRDNIVPMCAYAHEQQHRWGLQSFEREWKVSLLAEAQRIGRELRHMGWYEQAAGS